MYLLINLCVICVYESWRSSYGLHMVYLIKDQWTQSYRVWVIYSQQLYTSGGSTVLQPYPRVNQQQLLSLKHLSSQIYYMLHAVHAIADAG